MQQQLTTTEIATIAELVDAQISVGTPDDDVEQIGHLNDILTKLATY